MKTAKRRAIISYLIILTGLIFLTFSPCLKNGFVNWDEDKYLLENTAIRDFSPSGAIKLLNPHVIEFYIPLTLYTYSIEYHYFKLKPFIYHFDNIALHVLNTLLVFWLIYLLSSNIEVALISAAMFGVSPLRVESVAWVMERKDVLYSFFYLSAMVSYIWFVKSRLAGYFWATLFLFLCSLLAKPQALPFPLIMLAIDHYFKRPWNRQLFMEKLPFCLIGVLFLILLYTGVEHLTFPDQDPKLWFAGAYVLILYLIKSFIPFHLSCISPIPKASSGLFTWEVYASIPVVLGAGWLISKQCAKDKVIIFCSLLYAILMILPILNMRYSHGVFYEHYLYLPSIGLYFLFTSKLINGLDQPHLRKFKQGIMLILGGYILLNAWISFERCGIWKDSMTLWTDVIQHRPQALKFDPVYALAYNNRGLEYYHRGNFNQAIIDLNSAININHQYYESFNNLGVLYSIKGNLIPAISDFNQAIDIKPDYAQAYYNRGNLHDKQGNFTQAISDYNKAIDIEPDNAAVYYNRAIVYTKLNELTLALSDYTKAIGINPYYADAYNNRGFIYGNQGDFVKAISDFNKVIELNPNYAITYKSRAVCHYQLKEYDQAWDDVHRAEELGEAIGPDFISGLKQATGKNN